MACRVGGAVEELLPVATVGGRRGRRGGLAILPALLSYARCGVVWVGAAALVGCGWRQWIVRLPALASTESPSAKKF